MKDQSTLQCWALSVSKSSTFNWYYGRRNIYSLLTPRQTDSRHMCHGGRKRIGAGSEVCPCVVSGSNHSRHRRDGKCSRGGGRGSVAERLVTEVRGQRPMDEGPRSAALCFVNTGTAVHSSNAES